jgi:hypothetical protein
MVWCVLSGAVKIKPDDTVKMDDKKALGSGCCLPERECFYLTVNFSARSEWSVK